MTIKNITIYNLMTLRVLVAFILSLSALMTTTFPISSFASTSKRVNKSSDNSYIGILVPVSPSNYHLLTDYFIKNKTVQIEKFTYEVGHIYGVPVVLCIQPFGGVATRAISAQLMIDNFNVKALFYPGTSGAHLPPSKMQIGDIVVGTKQVNYSNFYMSPKGIIVPDEFKGKSSLGKYLNIYINNTLERYVACSAAAVDNKTTIPKWVNGKYSTRKPSIFYYGIQGTSTMFVADKIFVKKVNRIFHVIDGDGDWYSALVARLSDIPFIEVSTISNSIYEYSGRGFPLREGHSQSASQIAQNISDKIVIRIIKKHGYNILNANYKYPIRSPYPAYFYLTPINPEGITSECN